MMAAWLQDFRENFKPRRKIYDEIFENSRFSSIYFMMLVLSALISLAGLLTNSGAVLIGAMLISPLMGPILTFGLALTLADLNLGKKSGRNLLLSIAEGVLVTALATWLSPLKDATPEILARTSPNLMDLLIAVFSGIAGTLALTSSKGGMATILPGVAIATAVMPPLATVGYGVSTGQWDVASGALMLFLTNLMAIVVSSSAVFFLIGFGPKQELGTARHHVLVRYRMVGALALLALLSIPLFQTLMQASRQSAFRYKISDTLHHELKHHDGDLSGFSFSEDGQVVRVNATIRSSTFVPATEIQQMEKQIGQRLNKQVVLNLRQVLFATHTSSSEQTSGKSADYVAGGVVRPSATIAQSPSVALRTAQQEIWNHLESLAASVDITHVVIQSIRVQPDSMVEISFTSDAAHLTDPSAWALIGKALAIQLNTEVHLKGTVALASSDVDLVHLRKPSPDGKSLDSARDALDPCLQRIDCEIAVSVSDGSSPREVARRLAQVKAAIPQFKSTAGYTTESSLPSDTMRFRSSQTVDVTSRPGEPQASENDANAQSPAKADVK